MDGWMSCSAVMEHTSFFPAVVMGLATAVYSHRHVYVTVGCRRPHCRIPTIGQCPQPSQHPNTCLRFGRLSTCDAAALPCPCLTTYSRDKQEQPVGDPRHLIRWIATTSQRHGHCSLRPVYAPSRGPLKMRPGSTPI
jgi:hypothetical protein